VGRSNLPLARTTDGGYLRRRGQDNVLPTPHDRSNLLGHRSRDTLHDSRQHGFIVDGKVRRNSLHSAGIGLNRKCLCHSLGLRGIRNKYFFSGRLFHMLGQLFSLHRYLLRSEELVSIL
jgi:hypothetical protein